MLAHILPGNVGCFDALDVERSNADRIKGIAVLGINTFGWTFKNCSLDIPSGPPYLRLTSPSGNRWEWGEPDDVEYIHGDAAEFCQVVTQTRNVADTNLRVSGDTANRWMSIAQCFAGPPEDPPKPGSRHRMV